jgi:uncharacterized protein YdhG (YjbR/CyaY superfamily)
VKEDARLVRRKEFRAMAFKTMDDYFASQPEVARVKLSLVRAAIRRGVPEAQEVISYQIPAFRSGGRIFIFFAGWKNHYSIYPASESMLSAFGDELAPYKISKGTIRFPLTDPVPEELISRIAAFKSLETLKRVPKESPA